MDFLDRFKQIREGWGRLTGAKLVFRPASFSVWADPQVHRPIEEWERRLNNYAHKCARQLTEASVPLFQSQCPLKGEGTYRDAFWLIACNVESGGRVYVATPLPYRQKALGSCCPPPFQRGDYNGWFSGDALLLTKSGILCVARVSGSLVRTDGKVDNQSMNVMFRDIGRPEDVIKSVDWGWSNRGKWRRDPTLDSTIQGVKCYVNGMRFDEKRHRTTPYADDGRDTSAALSNFVKTNGQVRWPRGFTTFPS